MSRVVAIFTGNRAEYGLQYPILRAVAAHAALDYRLIVSGAHLSPQFGNTRREIEADGFHIDAEVRIDMPPDSLTATATAIGSGILSMTSALQRLRPDLLVVYADRFEGFAAVIASSQMSIPTAHVEGGDRTEGGAFDDSVRHAMTKLAHLHFTTNRQATNRLLAMGEEAWRVHTVGFPAIDLIVDGRFASADEIVSRFGLDLNRPIVLFTQHSVTTEFERAVDQVRPCLAALAALSGEGVQVLLTYPNNDAGGRLIAAELERFAATGRPNILLHQSLGRWHYHGILALARRPGARVVCAGNSSSGIKETPAFGCPSVNIGSRQEGRLRADNVIDVGYEAAAIEAALRQALFDDEFRRAASRCENPYGGGDSGRRIAEVLATVPLGEKLIRKRMTLAGKEKEGWFQ